MMETFTTTLNSATKQVDGREADIAEHVGIDAMLFYKSLHSDLNKLEDLPSIETIDRILNYSKNFKG